jgi:membrane protein DedA with SNARE-associated domain
MDLSNFDAAFAWVIAHGYLLMFFIMMAEGPIITAAASFAAALGYFNIFIIIVLAVFADWITDLFFYTIGYFGRKKLINKYGPRFGLTAARMERLENFSRNHRIKAMLAVKLSPFIAFPGLMFMGATRMPVKKFALYCFLMIFPYVLFNASLGYFFGRSYELIFGYLENGILLIISALAASIVIFFVYKKIIKRISRNIEKI